ncbi:MAG: nucleoside triphosphate pyrophosphohydrolase [Clostridia bacterium]|nr:nucleoside triphosphate pyrophosphohydrolase [Clostridia bacterium]
MVSDFQFKDRYSCEDLVNIVAILRAPGGCPWDAEQSHESIRRDFIEETYEVIEAINKKNPEMLREELGDVLLQVVFHTLIETEKGVFTFDDVCDEICKKLIIRHPHVFGDVNVASTEEVLTNWDAIKMSTKQQKNTTEAMLSVPREFPALMRAAKIQKKASKAGFDWKDIKGTLDKVKEETAEVEEAISCGDSELLKEEIGDLLFAVVNVSRFSGVDPEEALTVASDKFLDRFSLVEKMASEQGIDIKTADVEKFDELWEKAKLILKEQTP